MRTDTDVDGERPAEDDFLARWSRRKRAARSADSDNVEERAEAPETPEDVPTPALVDEDMPPVESLDERSDVSGFLSSGVSEELRRQALRRIFHLGRYHHRDGLDDYDADYRNFEPLGDVMTADQRLRQERLARRAQELLEEQAPEENEELARGDSGSEDDGSEPKRPS